MSLAFYLYLASFVENIDKVCEFITGIYLVMFFFGGLIFLITMDEYSKDMNEKAKDFISKINKKLWIVITAIVLAVFIPSPSTIYLMLGASFLEHSSLPTKVEKALELKLDNVIEDLSKKEKK